MKRILIITLIFGFGLLSNFSFAQASSGTDYYANLTVSATSNPPASADGILYAKMGDNITFTRAFSMDIGIGTSHWLFSPFILSCDTGGDPTITCKVIGKGDGTMAYSVEVMTDWTEKSSSYKTFSAPVLKIHVDDGKAPSTNSVVKTTASIPRVSVGKPDLTIMASKAVLVKHKVNGVLKSQYRIGVTVFNKSMGDAVGDVYYSYADNAPILISKGTLYAGKSKKVFIYLDTTEKGKSYVFTVDPDNTIGEKNENNNTATRIIGK